MATSDPDPSLATEEPSWERRWPPVTYWAKVAAAVGVTLALLYQVRFVADILVLLLVSIVLAAGLDPLAQRLERAGLTRARAVAVIFGTAAVVVVVVVALVAPAVTDQLGGLSKDLPRYVADVQSRQGWIGDYLERTHAVAQVQGFLEHLPQRVADSFGTILGFAGKVGAAILGIVTVVILTGYLLASLPRLRRTVTIVVPPEHRDRAQAAVDRSLARIGAYVAGNVITSIACGATTTLALVTIGTPFAVPLGIWAGITDLLPILGPFLGAAPAIVVASFVSPWTGVATAVFFIVYQQFENYVLVPRVMRDAVHLSPAAVILSTLVGASLAGFAGALLALPVVATLKVVLVESWLRDRVDDGDPLAKEKLRQVRRQERDARHARSARAALRRRVLARVPRLRSRSD